MGGWGRAPMETRARGEVRRTRPPGLLSAVVWPGVVSGGPAALGTDCGPALPQGPTPTGHFWKRPPPRRGWHEMPMCGGRGRGEDKNPVFHHKHQKRTLEPFQKSKRSHHVGNPWPSFRSHGSVVKKKSFKNKST